MLFPRLLRRGHLSTVLRLLILVVIFVFTVQLIYLHTHTAEARPPHLVGKVFNWTSAVEERRENLTGVVYNPNCQAQDEPKPEEYRQNAPPLLYFPDLFFKPPYQPLVYGTPRRNKGYLTIGIPSVRRPNTDRIYLFDLLNSIIEKTQMAEHNQITIVVMLSDTNKTYNNRVAFEVYSRYSSFCENGTILILNTVDCIYPDLNNVKPTFNDPKPRLKWRAKQNIDFAFIMLYSQNLSDYYIQIEDDVIVATDYFKYIQTTINKRSTPWFLLEFSRLGFIGKLFRSSDLQFVSMYLLKYYDRAPCDLLLGDIRAEKSQKVPLHSKKSLFQHIGRFSSLKNKLVPAIDKTFKDAVNLEFFQDLPTGDNPPALIKTSLIAYEHHLPQHAYDNDNSTYFWAKTPRKGDDFVLIFEKSFNFSRVIIVTGSLGKKKDPFLYSVLMYSQSTELHASENQTSCVNKFIKLVDFKGGEIDTLATGTIIPDNIKCLRIKATKTISNWVIIRDIQVFVKH